MYDLHLFLGSLSTAGFFSCAPRYAARRTGRLILLHGGPGSAAHLLLAQAADALSQAGFPVWRAHCPLHPNLLDGVVCPAQGLAVFNADAAAFAPVAPGAFEEVVCLYPALDLAFLQSRREEILHLLCRRNMLENRAARLVAAAAGMLGEEMRAASGCVLPPKLARYIAAASAALPKAPGEGVLYEALADSLTPGGLHSFAAQLAQSCPAPHVLWDDTGYVASSIVAALAKAAAAAGQPALLLHSPLAPDLRPRHLLLPALGQGWFTASRAFPLDLPGQKNVRCTRFCNADLLAACRPQLRRARKARAELLEKACELEQQTAEVHGRLAALYDSATRFEQLPAVQSLLRL